MNFHEWTKRLYLSIITQNKKKWASLSDIWNMYEYEYEIFKLNLEEKKHKSFLD